MHHRTMIVLAGSSLLALATAAEAQPAAPQPDTKSADPATVAQEANEAAEQVGQDGAIIITARRRAETLIDVPQTVNAVTAQQVQDFQILDFEDISQLVPGLTLDSNNQGFAATAQVRGVNFQVTAQGTPTIEMYLNEVPVEPNTMFQATFDIGQVEVLRGPQGTLRGRSSPSGAITYTTRRPDLNETGGYVSMTGTHRGDINMQGALNVPIISDVLALRVAGLIDENDAGGVKSANSGVNPSERTQAFRATLRFEPSDNFSAVITYQYLERIIRAYGGVVFGSGAVGLTGFPNFTRPGSAGNLTGTAAQCPPGSTVGLGTCVSLSGGNPGVFAPPGFNGPVLLEADADENGRSITDFRDYTRNAYNIVTAQLDWRFAGQRLSYVGGLTNGATLNLVDGDGTNTIVGVRRKQSRNACCGEDRRSHELRLSSDERLFDLFDYTIGGYYGKQTSRTINENLNQFLLPGAFGSPLGLTATTALGLPLSVLSPFTYNPQYSMGFTNIVPQKQVEKAIFANLMLHLGESTEISAGGRQIWRSKDSEVAPVLSNGVSAIRNPNATALNPFSPCPATLSGPGAVGNVINGRVIGQTYPGTCDVEVTPGNGALAVVIPPIARNVQKWSPFVYFLSASHKFTPDLMVYANYGTSWRQGPGPVIAAPVCAAQLTKDATGAVPAGVDPNLCNGFNFLNSETTKGFELGFKADLLNRRLNLAVALYQQKFKGFFIRADQSVPNLTGDCDPLPVNNVQGGCSVGTGTFTYNADVKVKGIDFEANFRVNEDLNAAALFSWSKGRFQDSPIPCRDTNFDGVPDSDALPSGPADWIARGGPYGPAMCPTGGSSTTAPPWNVTLRGEYSHEVFTGGRAFIRALFNYYPKNTNRPDAIAVDGPPPTRIAPESYSLLNLWIGLRGERGDWEVSASARNLLDTRKVTSRALDVPNLINPTNALQFGIPTTGTNVPSGYRSISFLQAREFSMSFRYSFGSR